MCNNYFEIGSPVDLQMILDSREKRQAKQKYFLKKYPGSSLICLTLNIPGPIKTNETLQKVYDSFYQQVLKELEIDIISVYSENLVTGNEGYINCKLPINQVKLKMIELEETHPFGRLMDIDVMILVQEKLEIISRTALGYSMRQCFICQKTAKECGRNRTHSVEELQLALTQIIQRGGNK